MNVPGDRCYQVGVAGQRRQQLWVVGGLADQVRVREELGNQLGVVFNRGDDGVGTALDFENSSVELLSTWILSRKLKHSMYFLIDVIVKIERAPSNSIQSTSISSVKYMGPPCTVEET